MPDAPAGRCRPTAGPADADGPPAGAQQPNSTLETIVVTGSYIRRTNSESPSPVTTIDADFIEKSGLNSIADVIKTVSADNSGTLSQAFSGAMAGGADGVALRGLSVDATLVLVDGHRMANYPLADDGQRQFVDIDSLPMAIVDRVEVLKDGASATYGSDAIAGVVNVILKKEFTGLDVSATAGSTDRGDGLSQRFAATWGTGNLEADGHNFYMSLEGRHQEAISQEARGSYIAASDLTPWGGPNLYGGVVNGGLPNPLTTYTVPGQVLPVSGGAVQNQTPFSLPGCSAQDIALAADGGGRMRVGHERLQETAAADRWPRLLHPLEPAPRRRLAEFTGGFLLPDAGGAIPAAERLRRRHQPRAFRLGGRSGSLGEPVRSVDLAGGAAGQQPGQSVQSGEPLLRGGAKFLQLVGSRERIQQLHRRQGLVLRRTHQFAGRAHPVRHRRVPRHR